MKRIIVVPSPLALANLKFEELICYEKLTSILSLSDVLKYHRLNTLVATLIPEFMISSFKLICYEEENLNFIRTHSQQYEMICKKDTGKELKDDFYGVAGKILTKVDINTDTICLHVLGENDGEENVHDFLQVIDAVYGINSMISLDTFKKYLIS